MTAVNRASLRAAFRHSSDDAIDLAYRLIKGTADPLTVPAAANWAAQCYHPPGRTALVLCALDSLLETHGVEYLGDVDMHDGPPVAYLNTGDTYTPTVTRERDSGRYRVECYADALERLERAERRGKRAS